MARRKLRPTEMEVYDAPCEHCGAEPGEPCLYRGKIVADHLARKEYAEREVILVVNVTPWMDQAFEKLQQQAWQRCIAMRDIVS